MKQLNKSRAFWAPADDNGPDNKDIWEEARVKPSLFGRQLPKDSESNKFSWSRGRRGSMYWMLIALMLMVAIWMIRDNDGNFDANSPENQEYRSLLESAEQAQEVRDHLKAKDDLEQAVQIFPNRYDAYLLLVPTYLAIGEIEAAEVVAERAIEYAPDDSKSQVNARLAQYWPEKYSSAAMQQQNTTDALEENLEENIPPEEAEHEEEQETLSKPQHSLDFIGLSVDDVAKMLGDDYQQRYWGGSNGLFYENLGLHLFYGHAGEPQPGDVITAVSCSGDYSPCPGIELGMSLSDLEQKLGREVGLDLNEEEGAYVAYYSYDGHEIFLMGPQVPVEEWRVSYYLIK